jgi:hypothetical protein
MKELYTSIVAYNLAVQFRRQAAESGPSGATQAELHGQSTSASDTVCSFNLHLHAAFEQWTERYEALRFGTVRPISAPTCSRLCSSPE